MEIYLIKSTTILAIFWVLYVLFLEKENMHRFKRFYLMISIIAAFCIPLLSITEYIYVKTIDGFKFGNEVIPFVIKETQPIIETPFWTLDHILLTIYLIGVVVFSIRFFKNIFNMIKIITSNEKKKQSSITFVLLKRFINPHTFFNFIFLNKSKFYKNEVPKEVILHEETHAKQKHSLDILFIEILQIIFWFQPFIWLYKKRIKLNHEFLADQAVIEKGVQPAAYQNTLLSYSSHQDYSLSNAINYSSIKKRFTVMKTQTSQKKKWLFSLLILPILGILFYSFSERKIVEVEKPAEKFLERIQSKNQTKSNGASEKQMKEYKNFILNYNETNTIYVKAYERAIIIYDKLMSDAQRASVEKYPKRMIPMPNLSKVEPKAPTKAEFEAYKNADVYAIWIDNKHVSNSELNNYSFEDIVHVSGSHVYKNARSKKFSQPNQYHLFTKEGFKASYQDSQLKRYYKAAKAYTDKVKSYLNGSQTDNSELIILKTQADAIYSTFSKAEIKADGIKRTPPVPAEYKTDQRVGQKNPPTAKEITDYNAWTKKISNQINKAKSNKNFDYPIIKQKDIQRYKSIYDRMSDKQKANAEAFPNIPPPPPPPPAAKVKQYTNGKNKNLDYIIKNTRKGAESGYEVLENGESHYYIIYKGKKTYYNKDGYMTDDKGNVLPPPPPPPPAPKKSKSKGGPNAEGYETATNNYFSFTKRRIYISISKNGHLSMVEGQLLDPKFKPTTIKEIEEFLSQLSTKELKNTFIFTNGKDLKTYRSKPSDTPEYQDDIEIFLIKSKNGVSNTTKNLTQILKQKNSKVFGYELALDNNQDLKNRTLEIIKVFKKFKGINTTH